MGKGSRGGAASRQGVEASGLDTPTVKMDKKGGFQATSQLPVGRGPNHESLDAQHNSKLSFFLQSLYNHSPIEK